MTKVSAVDLAAGFGRATQSTIYRAGASGVRPAVPTRWDELVAAAERRISPDAWAYIAGSSGREGTADATCSSWCTATTTSSRAWSRARSDSARRRSS